MLPVSFLEKDQISLRYALELNQLTTYNINIGIYSGFYNIL